MSARVEICIGPNRVEVCGDDPTVDLACLAIQLWEDVIGAAPEPPAMGPSGLGFNIENFAPAMPDRRAAVQLPYPQ